MDPSFDNDQYLVMNQNEEEEEEDDEVISYWSEDDGDQSFDEVGSDFPNEVEVLYDLTKAMHVWKPLKEEDQSIELKEDEEKSGKP